MPSVENTMIKARKLRTEVISQRENAIFFRSIIHLKLFIKSEKKNLNTSLTYPALVFIYLLHSQFNILKVTTIVLYNNETQHFDEYV